ncbi:phospholipid-binding lipoprotein MlaA [Sphingomonas laterariae]|uniref:Phospholipid-binding lipoprotein MlaA n=1 Tax=Edaphosphingomonas laterariae TaxID=861865 RepID=A0A239KH51_9SPHN|nr:VacJ family lipoprotein [Sphingomonas laterariae]SNT17405.1 phospholipid-binding lipoprotein MlaA [Sphingomonas laterariae]
MRVFATFAAAALLAGCATTKDAAAPAAERDPLEGFNRAVWGLNQGVDKIALKPVSTVYRAVTPRAARRGILHIFDNLTEPWSFINNLLQGKPDRALNNLGRFVVNTTIGVGGLADHATDLGIRPAREDFGQTLAVWGVKSSSYLVLPLLGPSTIRDGVGTGVNFVIDPVNYCLRKCTDLSYWERQIPRGINLVSQRANLTETGADTLLDTSLDSYATARSAFFQRRAAEIADLDDAAGTASDADVDAAIRELESEDGEATLPPETGDETPVPPETSPDSTEDKTGSPDPISGDPATGELPQPQQPAPEADFPAPANAPK